MCKLAEAAGRLCPGYEGAVKLPHFGGEAADGEEFVALGAGGVGEFVLEGRVFCELQQALGEQLGLCWGKEGGVVVFEQFADAAGCGADERDAGGHAGEDGQVGEGIVGDQKREIGRGDEVGETRGGGIDGQIGRPTAYEGEKRVMGAAGAEGHHAVGGVKAIENGGGLGGELAVGPAACLTEDQDCLFRVGEAESGADGIAVLAELEPAFDTGAHERAGFGGDAVFEQGSMVFGAEAADVHAAFGGGSAQPPGVGERGERRRSEQNRDASEGGGFQAGAAPGMHEGAVAFEETEDGKWSGTRGAAAAESEQFKLELVLEAVAKQVEGGQAAEEVLGVAEIEDTFGHTRTVALAAALARMPGVVLIVAIKEFIMFVHNVLFTLKGDKAVSGPALLAAMEKHLRGVPGVRHLWTGKPLQARRPVIDNDYDVALCVVFDDQAAHDVYQEHPKHLAFIKEASVNWSKVRVIDFA